MASFAANKSALSAAQQQRCGAPSAICSIRSVQRYNGCTAFSGAVEGARLQQSVARCVRINT